MDDNRDSPPSNLLQREDGIITEEDVDSDNESVDSLQLLADIADAINSYSEDGGADFLNIEDGGVKEDSDSENIEASNRNSQTSSKTALVSVEDLIKAADQPNSSDISLLSESSLITAKLKEPVICLTRLNPNVRTCKVIAVKNKDSDTYSYTLEAVDKKAHKRTEIKKSSWYDNDSSLSGISVSDVSDSEDFTVKESNISRSSHSANSKGSGEKTNSDNVKSQEEGKAQEKIVKHQTGHSKHSSKDISSERSKGKNTDSNVKSKTSLASSTSQSKKTNSNINITSGSKVSESKSRLSESKHVRTHKTSGKEPFPTERSKVQTSSDSRKRKLFKEDGGCEIIEALLSSSDKISKVTSNESKNTGDIPPRRSDWCYELNLSSFGIEELSNENFRKFINLASDFGIKFDPPLSNGHSRGHVQLYFGCMSNMQSSMQKLSQLSFASPKVLHGVITCLHMKPAGRSEAHAKWKVTEEVKLGFTLTTTWTEKLKQLVQAKDWKRDGESKRKCAQIERIPPYVSTEMLSLLFPFSQNVHTPKPNTGVHKKGSVEIEFENTAWMETVLSCFRHFYAIRKGSGDPVWRFTIPNFKPPQEKIPEPAPIKASQNRAARKDSLDSKAASHPRQKESFKGRNVEPYNKLRRSDSYQGLTMNTPSSKDKGDNSSSSSNSNRKRPYSTSEKDIKTAPSEKKGKFVDQDHNLESLDQRVDQRDKTTSQNSEGESLKLLAQSKGLDPNNADVIRILEVQNQLSSLQALFSCIESEEPSSSLPQTGQGSAEVSQKHSPLKPSGRKGSSSSQGNIDFLEAERQIIDNIAVKQRQLKELEEKFHHKKSAKISTAGSSTSKSFPPKQSVNIHNEMEALPMHFIPPSQNDEPLDFTKPAPKIEEAVKEDEKRSKMLAVKTSAPLPTPQISKGGKKDNSKQPSISAEDFALPLQFGKNVKKAASEVLAKETTNARKTPENRMSVERRGGILRGKERFEHSRHTENQNQKGINQRGQEFQAREANQSVKRANQAPPPFHRNMDEKSRMFEPDFKRPESNQRNRNSQRDPLFPASENIRRGVNVSNQTRDKGREMMNHPPHGARESFGKGVYFENEHERDRFGVWNSSQSPVSHDFAHERYRGDSPRDARHFGSSQHRETDRQSPFDDSWRGKAQGDTRQFPEGGMLRSSDPERSRVMQARDSGLLEFEDVGIGGRGPPQTRRGPGGMDSQRGQGMRGQGMERQRDVEMRGGHGDHPLGAGRDLELQRGFEMQGRENMETLRGPRSDRNFGRDPEDMEMDDRGGHFHRNPDVRELNERSMVSHPDRGRGTGLLRGTGMRGRGTEPQRGGGMRGRGLESPREGGAMRGRSLESPRSEAMRGRGTEPQRGGGGMRGRGIESPREGGAMRGRGTEPQRGGGEMRGRGIEPTRGRGMRGRGVEPPRGRGGGMRGRGTEPQRGGDGLLGPGPSHDGDIHGNFQDFEGSFGQERFFENEQESDMFGVSNSSQSRLSDSFVHESNRGDSSRDRSYHGESSFDNSWPENAQDESRRFPEANTFRSPGRERNLESHRGPGVDETVRDSQRGRGMRGRGRGHQGDMEMRGRHGDLSLGAEFDDRDRELPRGFGMQGRGPESDGSFGRDPDVQEVGRGRGLGSQRGGGRMRGRGVEFQRGGDGILGQGHSHDYDIHGNLQDFEPERGNNISEGILGQGRNAGRGMEPLRGGGGGMRGRGTERPRGGVGAMRGRGTEPQRGRGGGIRGRDHQSDGDGLLGPGPSHDYENFQDFEPERGDNISEGILGQGRGAGRGRGMEPQRDRGGGMRGRGSEPQRGGGSGMRGRDTEPQRGRGGGMRGRGTEPQRWSDGLLGLGPSHDCDIHGNFQDFEPERGDNMSEGQGRDVGRGRGMEPQRGRGGGMRGRGSEPQRGGDSGMRGRGSEPQRGGDSGMRGRGSEPQRGGGSGMRGRGSEPQRGGGSGMRGRGSEPQRGGGSGMRGRGAEPQRGRGSGMRGRGAEPQQGGDGLLGPGPSHDYDIHGNFQDFEPERGVNISEGILGQGRDSGRGRGMQPPIEMMSGLESGSGMRGRGGRGAGLQRGNKISESNVEYEGGFGKIVKTMEAHDVSDFSEMSGMGFEFPISDRGGRGSGTHRGAGMRGRGLEAQRGSGMRGRGSEAQKGSGNRGRDSEAQRGSGKRGRGSEVQRDPGMNWSNSSSSGGTSMMDKSGFFSFDDTSIREDHHQGSRNFGMNASFQRGGHQGSGGTEFGRGGFRGRGNANRGGGQNMGGMGVDRGGRGNFGGSKGGQRRGNNMTRR